MTTRATDVARDFILGTINEFPVIASDIIYEGSAVGLNSSRYARPLVAGDPFVGFAESKADNSASGSAAGDVNVRVRTSGVVKLAITSAALGDVGKEVFASDDDTFTFVKGARNTKIGYTSRYVSSGYMEVTFEAIGFDYEVSAPPLVGKIHHGIESVSASQVYPFGTIMRKRDGREYRYAKAGGTVGGNLGAHNGAVQQVGHVVVNTSADAGVSEVAITVGASDGAAANGNIAANELLGGYIFIFVDGTGADQKCFMRGIVSNTATTGGGTMTVGLDDPTPVALVADTAYAECMGSPYSSVTETNATGQAVVGVPTTRATTGQFLWLQTKGACWVSPQAALGVGVAMEAVFRHDGSVDAHEYNDAYATSAQHAGYVMDSLAGATQALPFIMLDI